MIERSEFASYVEQNRINIEANPSVYKQRQSLVEHPCGTTKKTIRVLLCDYKKGMERASSDVGFMFITYNLRRLMNLIDKTLFTKFLRELVVLSFFEKLASLKAIIFKIRPIIFYAARFQNILPAG